jgi:predicted acetyltransferase
VAAGVLAAIWRGALRNDHFRTPGLDVCCHVRIAPESRTPLMRESVGPVDISLIAATDEDRRVVRRLLQLYEYDNSEFFGADVDSDGYYRVVDVDALFQPGSDVFVFKVDDKLAGFAIVTRHVSYIGDGETWLMDEFFVMRKYRRRGVGSHVAHALFDRFPGRWEISQWPTNLPSQAFWRSVIGRYIHGPVNEAFLDMPRIRGFVQWFASAPPTAGECVCDSIS